MKVKLREMGKIKGSKITNADKSHLKEVKGSDSTDALFNDNQVVKYYITERRQILNELNSNRKSNEILERFINISAISNKLLAEKIFEISPKTLHTYKHSEKVLPIRINEQVLKLEGLYIKGIELFESQQQFNKWLNIESYGLGHIKPIDMLNSITGIDLVYEELVRIEFGATA